MDIKNSFKKGCVEMLLLAVLENEDMYGYQISQTILSRGGDYLKIPEGSMYPTLYKLQDKGMVSSYEQQAGKRLKRIYYHIEKPGLEYLKELKKEYYIVNESIMKFLKYKADD